MSQTHNLKKIKTNNGNKSSNALNIELCGSNIRNILERLNHNRFYATIKVEKNSYEKNEKIKKEKTQPNLKVAEIFNSNKIIMQEKEKKDLEKIYKKWEQPKLISSRFNNIRKFDARRFNISYLKNLKINIKNELKNKIVFDKKVNEDKNNNFFDEKQRQKFEEKIKKIEKLNQIQSTCNMIYLSENINEI